MKWDYNMLDLTKKNMVIQNKTINAIEKEVEVLMQFAAQTGIPVEDITSKYSITDISLLEGEVVLESKEGDIDEVNLDTIKMTFNKEKQLVTIVRMLENKRDFVTYNDGLLPSYQQYLRKVYQDVTEFRINGNNLDVTNASISQSTREDTIGGGAWDIVNFTSISDFEDENHIKSLRMASDYTINKESYEIPENYRLQDGLEAITSTDKIKKLNI